MKNRKRWFQAVIVMIAVWMTGAYAQAGEEDTLTLAVCVAGPDHEWTEDVMQYAKEELLNEHCGCRGF